MSVETKLNPTEICNPNADMITGEPLSNDQKLYIFLFPSREKAICLTKEELEHVMNNSEVGVWIDHHTRSSIEREVTIHPYLRNTRYRYPVGVFKIPYQEVWIKKFDIPDETGIFYTFPSFISELGTYMGIGRIHGGRDYVVYKTDLISNDDFNTYIEQTGFRNIPIPKEKLEWVKSFLQNPLTEINMTNQQQEEQRQRFNQYAEEDMRFIMGNDDEEDQLQDMYRRLRNVSSREEELEIHRSLWIAGDRNRERLIRADNLAREGVNERMQEERRNNRSVAQQRRRNQDADSEEMRDLSQLSRRLRRGRRP